MAHSLLTEGYIIRVNVTLPGSHIISMKHRTNGNVITIFGNFKTGQIRLVKNGRERHRETISD